MKTRMNIIRQRKITYTVYVYVCICYRGNSRTKKGKYFQK